MSTAEIAAVLSKLQFVILLAGAALLLTLEALPATGLAPRGWAHWRHVLRNISLWLLTFGLIQLLWGAKSLHAMRALDSGRIGLLYVVNLPTWMHAILGLLAYDFGDYLFHRISHKVRWLWLLHATHHTDDAMDISTFLRTHPVHVVAIVLWRLLVVAVIGVPYWVMLLREVLAIPVAQLHHSAVRWPPLLDRLLRPFIVTPDMHRVHHSPQLKETNSNYSSLFPWWDKLCNSYVSPTLSSTGTLPRTGLNAANDDRWQSLWGMLMTPLRGRRYAQL